MVKEKILDNLRKSLVKLGLEKWDRIDLETPAMRDFGDYSTGVALKLTKELKKSPLEIANQIVDGLEKNNLIEKVEVVKPGFINFWVNNEYLSTEAEKISQGKINFFPVHIGPAKKIMVEFAHPNTHKLFHIGHLRNISTGESIVRILEASGNQVIRTNYQGDVGLHIAKCLWYIKNKVSENRLNQIRKNKLSKKIAFLGKAYFEGQIAYDSDEKTKAAIIEINGMIYSQDGSIVPLWKETRQWSIDYFEENYKRLYSHFDRCYFESESPGHAVELCHLAKKKGILQTSQGALVFVGKPYGLDTRVFINSLGFPTYEGKELALAEKEFSDFDNIDKCLHVVTPEQKSFFKVTFKVEELLDKKKYKDKQYHLVYEWVNLKQGKMSSRTGNVVEANWLVDEAKKKITDKFKCADDVAEILAVGAVKYSFLKTATQNPISFDFYESISLEGNSAPYLIYTYVRTQSVLNKQSYTGGIKIPTFNKEEKDLFRLFFKFPEVVKNAARGYSPNLIAGYLHELAQHYNYFYQKHQILKAPDETKNLRLLVTKASGEIIKTGLNLLGIKTVEKM